MSAQATQPKRDEVIRFRAESDLKKRLNRIASLRRKKAPEYLRDKLWELVEAEEKTLTPETRAKK